VVMLWHVMFDMVVVRLVAIASIQSHLLQQMVDLLLCLLNLSVVDLGFMAVLLVVRVSVVVLLFLVVVWVSVMMILLVMVVWVSVMMLLLVVVWVNVMML